MIAKFRRSDGLELEAEVGSPSFELMAKDGAFARLDAVQPDQTAEPAAKVPEKPLSKMNREELVAEAAKRGIQVPEDWKKAQIIAAIEEKDAAAGEPPAAE